MPRLTKHEWASLWAVFWRVLLLAPFLWIVGFSLFVLVLVLLFAPLCFAIAEFMTGHWILGIALILAWIVIMRFSRRLLGWISQGMEYMSI